MTALLLNMLLTERMGADGSAVVWVLAESVIMVLSILAIYKEFHYIPPYKRLLTYTFSYTPLFIFSLLLYWYFKNTYVVLVLIAALTVIYAFFIELFVLKNKVATQLLQSIRRKKQ